MLIFLCSLVWQRASHRLLYLGTVSTFLPKVSVTHSVVLEWREEQNLCHLRRAELY